MLKPLTAKNTGPFTGKGTNTFIAGEENCVIIDPGPDDAAHIAAIVNKTINKNIHAIIITHRHKDHYAALKTLIKHIKAPIFAAPWALKPFEELHPLAQKFVACFAQEQSAPIKDPLGSEITHITCGNIIQTDTIALKAMHTPGHASDHLCFEILKGGTTTGLLTGDHIMDWSSTMITPPDGNMSAYMDSLKRCVVLSDVPFYPGHGDKIENGAHRAKVLLRHRMGRESTILRHVNTGIINLQILVETLYPDLPQAARRGAIGTTITHLIKLESENKLSTSTIRTDDLFRACTKMG